MDHKVRKCPLEEVDRLDFSRLWRSRTTGHYGNIQAHFISKQDLIESKRLSGRKQDLADIEKLEQIQSLNII